MQKATYILQASFSFLAPFPQPYFLQHFLNVLCADITPSPLQPSYILGQVEDGEATPKHGLSCTICSNRYFVRNRIKCSWQKPLFFMILFLLEKYIYETRYSNKGCRQGLLTVPMQGKAQTWQSRTGWSWLALPQGATGKIPTKEQLPPNINFIYIYTRNTIGF